MVPPLAPPMGRRRVPSYRNARLPEQPKTRMRRPSGPRIVPLGRGLSSAATAAPAGRYARPSIVVAHPTGGGAPFYARVADRSSARGCAYWEVEVAMALDCLLSTAELYKLCMDARLVAELSIPHHGAWERVLGAGVPEMPARTHILSAPWAAKQAMERWLRHRTALATISRLFSPLFALSCLINLNNSGVQAGSTVERACVLQSYTLLFEALEAPIAIPEGHMGRELSLGEGGHAQGRVGGWGASLLCGCKVVMYSSEGGPWDMRDGITKQSREGQPGQDRRPSWRIQRRRR